MQTGLRLRAAALGIVYAAVASPAAAITHVEGDSANFEWHAATGPVGAYLVYVSTNGGPMEFVASRHADQPWTTVHGKPGDEFQVQVQAISGVVIPSPLSPISEKIRLVEPGAGSPHPDYPDVPLPIVAPASPMDFDGDGDPDLLFRNIVNGALEVWRLDQGQTEPVDDLGRLGSDQQIVGNSDYDGDGYADLLLHDESRAELEVRFLVGGHLDGSVTHSVPPGWQVAASAVFAAEGAASVVLIDPETGALARIDPDGVSHLLPGISPGSKLLAALDLDDDRTDEILFYDWWTVFARFVDDHGSADVATGILTTSGIDIGAACDRLGTGRDTILASTASGQHLRLSFDGASHTLRVASLTNLGTMLRESPIMGAGDYDGDGDCDAAIRAPDRSTWLVLLDGHQADSAWRIPPPAAGWLPAGVGAEGRYP